MKAAVGIWVVLGAAFHSPASGQAGGGDRWLHVGSSSRANVYVDSRRVSRNGSRVTVWQRSSYFRPQAEGVTTALDQFVYDCEASTSDLLAYTLQRADGSVLRSNVVPPSQREARPVTPDSIAESVFEYVCGS